MLMQDEILSQIEAKERECELLLMEIAQLKADQAREYQDRNDEIALRLGRLALHCGLHVFTPDVLEAGFEHLELTLLYDGKDCDGTKWWSLKTALEFARYIEFIGRKGYTELIARNPETGVETVIIPNTLAVER